MYFPIIRTFAGSNPVGSGVCQLCGCAEAGASHTEEDSADHQPPLHYFLQCPALSRPRQQLLQVQSSDQSGVWCQGLDLYFLSVKLWQSWLSQFPNFSPFSDSVWLIAAAAATESDILISKVLLKSQPIICHKARPRPECFPTFQLPFFRPLRELCPAWDCCPERSSSRWAAVNTAPSIVTILADAEPFPSEFSLARWYCTGWRVRRGQWRSETLCRPMLSLHGADLLSICPVKILFPFIVQLLRAIVWV